ncbi:unnamed protein product [Sordaria macrospora k-hell]|uniref:WGS project CABT00000000 data, contig 2.12 n=1 Tax=Sordaria macrospora (strain ATCC MYA-333 / DSM 997 / K(L3346) / K-hell) TaxID=771870 RepID=F7VY38_SORMK|nr:uncharacterized protein SMAC_03003 [Sordaria macrospora k-hell]CCC10432.1 unnamed protein product [Sordaria macrospora k-hell]
MFSKQILIAAAFLATLSTAAPATGSASSDTTALKIDVPEGLKILEQYETKSGGTVVWFGDENPVNATNTVVPDEASTHALNRRCGSNRVACYGDHQTFMPTCEVMTLDTSVLLRDTPIPPQPSVHLLLPEGRHVLRQLGRQRVRGRLQTPHQRRECGQEGVPD